jgi:hypothetical protein
MEYKFASSAEELPGEWIWSDGLQIVRHITPDRFELAEVQTYTPDTFIVVRSEVDLADYTDEEVLNYTTGYGYKSIADVEKQYGPEARQIIAECIFENLGYYEYDFISSEFSSEDEAKAYLRTISNKA